LLTCFYSYPPKEGKDKKNNGARSFSHLRKERKKKRGGGGKGESLNPEMYALKLTLLYLGGGRRGKRRRVGPTSKHCMTLLILPIGGGKEGKKKRRRWGRKHVGLSLPTNFFNYRKEKDKEERGKRLVTHTSSLPEAGKEGGGGSPALLLPPFQLRKKRGKKKKERERREREESAHVSFSTPFARRRGKKKKERKNNGNVKGLLLLPFLNLSGGKKEGAIPHSGCQSLPKGKEKGGK